MMVRSVYEMAGLISPWKNSLPEDHISLELDAAMAMRLAAARVESPELTDIQHFFICGHMGRWLPLFHERVAGARSAHPAVTEAARLTSAWADAEGAAINNKAKQTILNWRMA